MPRSVTSRPPAREMPGTGTGERAMPIGRPRMRYAKSLAKTLGRSMCGSAGRDEGAAVSGVMGGMLRHAARRAQTGVPPSLRGLSPGLEEGQDGEHAAVVVVAGGQVELAEDVRD